MDLIEIGKVGSKQRTKVTSWLALDLPGRYAEVATLLAGGRPPRPLQVEALRTGLLRDRKNLLIAAPTNSGKTLVGYLVLIEALARGKRAVLLEPLRALAREKADELERLAPLLSEIIGRTITVRVSTGDYRLENETFSDPAPGAQLIIATPERLESILRVPDNQGLFTELGAVCVDEAHLIGESRRGATLECLITSLLCLPVPPRLVLLSATMGHTDKLVKWLHPCDVISVTERTPPLEKYLADLGSDEDATICAADWLKSELITEGTQALVFIYQARQTAGVASELTLLLGELAGGAGALPYHSKLPAAERQRVRHQFESGASKVIVTTSALAMGMNLPATHVVVRDLTFPGARNPGVSSILQMMGRAGRGDRSGKALVVKRSTDVWQTQVLVDTLRDETVPELTSVFAAEMYGRKSTDAPAATEPVASLLLRAGDEGRTSIELESFFARSFGGQSIVTQVPGALNWLKFESLAYLEDTSQHYRLTALGTATVRAVLPLKVGAGFARLIRDLLLMNEDGELLGRWTPLDFLICLGLLHDDTPSLRRFSADLTDQVMNWCEGHSNQVPVLFRKWMLGEKGHSKTVEVLGSMGIEPPSKVADLDEWCRQRGFLATFNAIVLYERAMGRSITDLQRQYGIENLDGVEERWRDTMIWLLSGVCQLLDVKVFYFHLKEECAASQERVTVVNRQLGDMRRQILELIEQIKFASPLGGLVLAMRRRNGKAGVGVESIRKLEEAGITQLGQILRLSPDDMKSMGLRKDISKKILGHIKHMAV